jgi:formate hydrogenlyase subunit 3/multisubunit Na+/H+ antiporter MnhD subunit
MTTTQLIIAIITSFIPFVAGLILLFDNLKKNKWKAVLGIVTALHVTGVMVLLFYMASHPNLAHH